MSAPFPVVLLTDFGTQDPYVGQMKSVLQWESPYPPIIDLSHDVPSQDETAAAFLLEYSIEYCPPNSILLLVVDPFVGTERDIIAAETTQDRVVVAPDRHLIDGLDFTKVHRVLQPNVPGLKQESDTFHGRDWFAPAGRILALGGTLEDLGPLIDYQSRNSRVPEPEKKDSEIVGEVVYVDRFGNLITNIPGEMVDKPNEWRVRIGDSTIEEYRQTYGKGNLPIFLEGSFKRYEIAVTGGNARKRLSVDPGDRVRFIHR